MSDENTIQNNSPNEEKQKIEPSINEEKTVIEPKKKENELESESSTLLSNTVTIAESNINNQAETIANGNEKTEVLQAKVNQGGKEEIQQFGRYKILKELGRGGMGVVYKAYDPQLDRNVALKVIRQDNSTPENLTRFIREARAIAKLEHQQIITIHDIGHENGKCFFTMSLIEGPSLKAIIEQAQISKCPLSIKKIIKIMIKICQGVQFAHQQGVIHRDLKPGNILMSKDDDPKVTDFGLAKMLESKEDISRTGMILGTLEYMSPEQAEGNQKEVDERSDIYSVGAIFYHLLTGQPPFTGDSAIRIIYKIANKTPRPIQELSPDVPKPVSDVCMKMLERNKNDRQQSMDEVIQELKTVRLQLNQTEGVINENGNKEIKADINTLKQTQATNNHIAKNSQTKEGEWYLKSRPNSRRIQGPFSDQKISKLLSSGELKERVCLSLDQKNWYELGEIPKTLSDDITKLEKAIIMEEIGLKKCCTQSNNKDDSSTCTSIYPLFLLRWKKQILACIGIVLILSILSLTGIFERDKKEKKNKNEKDPPPSIENTIESEAYKKEQTTTPKIIKSIDENYIPSEKKLTIYEIKPEEKNSISIQETNPIQSNNMLPIVPTEEIKPIFTEQPKEIKPIFTEQPKETINSIQTKNTQTITQEKCEKAILKFYTNLEKICEESSKNHDFEKAYRNMNSNMGTLLEFLAKEGLDIHSDETLTIAKNIRNKNKSIQPQQCFL